MCGDRSSETWKGSRCGAVIGYSHAWAMVGWDGRGKEGQVSWSKDAFG